MLEGDGENNLGKINLFRTYALRQGNATFFRNDFGKRTGWFRDYQVHGAGNVHLRRAGENMAGIRLWQELTLFRGN